MFSPSVNCLCVLEVFGVSTVATAPKQSPGVILLDAIKATSAKLRFIPNRVILCLEQEINACESTLEQVVDDVNKCLGSLERIYVSVVGGQQESRSKYKHTFQVL